MANSWPGKDFSVVGNRTEVLGCGGGVFHLHKTKHVKKPAHSIGKQYNNIIYYYFTIYNCIRKLELEFESLESLEKFPAHIRKIKSPKVVDFLSLYWHQ